MGIVSVTSMRKVAAWACAVATAVVASPALAQPLPEATHQSTAQAPPQAAAREPTAPPPEAAREVTAEPAPEAKREAPPPTPTAPETKQAAQPTVPSAAPEAKNEAAGEDWVEISLVASEPGLMLYAKDPRKITMGDQVADAWVWRCNAPCNERVDPRFTYRVMGEGILPSIEFHVAPNAGRVALQVSPAKQSSRTIAGALTVLGATSALAGVLSILVDVAERGAAGAVPAEMSGAKSSLYNSATSYENIGIGFITAGLVMEAGALVVLLTSKTNLTPIAAHTGWAPMPARGNASAEKSGVRLIPGGFAF
jgi:hypothetical protein